MEFQYDRYLVDQLIRPIAFVRQRKLAIKEDVRFYADEGETRELFRIAARSMLDIGGSRYDGVAPGGERIGFLWHKFRESLLRTTWHIGGWIPIPYNFEFLIDGAVVGGMDRKFQLRDSTSSTSPAIPTRRSTAASRSHSQSRSTRCRTAS